MADVYFLVVAAEYWDVMAAVAAVTPVVIAVWMYLEKSVTSLSILLGFRLGVSVLSSSLSAALFFDSHFAIVLVLRRS